MNCLILYEQGNKNRKLFWLPTISPLASVMISTLFVYLTRADKHGVQIVKHVKGGINPSSIHQLELNSPYIAEVVKIGLVAAVISLTVIHQFPSILRFS